MAVTAQPHQAATSPHHHDTPSRKRKLLKKISDKTMLNMEAGDKDNVLPVKLEIFGNVRNLSVELFKMTHLVSLKVNGNALEYLPKDIGKLANLRSLNLADNHLEYIPREMGQLTNMVKLNISNNYLKYLPDELGKMFKLKVLNLSGNPLDDPGLCSIINKEDAGRQIVQYLLNNYQMKLTQLPTRTYKQLAIPQSDLNYRFSILSFNILYERYCTSVLYPYCPNWARAWEYRKKIIFDQLMNASTDIIALQEIETGQFNQFFRPELAKIGYAGIFFPKSRSKTMSNDEKIHVDGCAIFYKVNKFIMVKEYVIEFNKSLSQYASGCDAMYNRVLMRDNIAIGALLKLNLPDGEIDASKSGMVLVTNAHIHWDPEFSDVKLVQTAILSYLVKNIVLEYCAMQNLPESSVPIILCGDFNSTPDSTVVNFITEGTMPVKDPEFQDFDYDTCLSTFMEKGGEGDEAFYVNNIPLESSYNINQGSKTVQYTNYTYHFREIIDYIFYSAHQLKPISVLGDIDYGWFKENDQHGMPNPYFPSDHIPLVTEFEWMSSGGGDGLNN